MRPHTHEYCTYCNLLNYYMPTMLLCIITIFLEFIRPTRCRAFATTPWSCKAGVGISGRGNRRRTQADEQGCCRTATLHTFGEGNPHLHRDYTVITRYIKNYPFHWNLVRSCPFSLYFSKGKQLSVHCFFSTLNYKKQKSIIF